VSPRPVASAGEGSHGDEDDDPSRVSTFGERSHLVTVPLQQVGLDRGRRLVPRQPIADLGSKRGRER